MGKRTTGYCPLHGMSFAGFFDQTVGSNPDFMRFDLRSQGSARCAKIRGADQPLDPGYPDARGNESVVLSVGAITVSEAEPVDGHVFKINIALFDECNRQPQPFIAFLNWNHAYSAIFVFQRQSLKPILHCGVIHARSTTPGKGASEIVSLLFSLKHRLEIHFHVCGVSCFNPRLFPDISVPPFVLSDLLHLMERIRCDYWRFFFF
jgi:hypothetical protein